MEQRHDLVFVPGTELTLAISNTAFLQQSQDHLACQSMGFLTCALSVAVAIAVAAPAVTLDPKSQVTLVVTSCRRPSSLLRLLDSLFQYNTFEFHSVIVAEASGDPDTNKEILTKYPLLTLVEGPRHQRRSQVDNIDAAYAQVNTKYVLHFEEDWVVHRDGFVPISIAVLESAPKVSVVSLHAPGASEFQVVDSEIIHGAGFMKRDLRGGWGYFSWGSGLRRMSDYHLVGNYKRYNATWKSNARLHEEAAKENVRILKRYIHFEWRINWLYKGMGFRVALINDSLPFASHAPQLREKHVPDIRGVSPFDA